MKPTSQTNSEEKINNIFGNFSTSESTHSKNTNKASTNQVQSAEKKPLQLLQLHQLQSKNNMESKCNEQNEEVSRLFTFMDEKEAERKIIQNYIKKDSLHKRYHNQLYEPKLTKHCQGIVKMIQDSRKKREEFLKKVTNNTLCLKQNKSNSRLNRISRSKTPKQMPYFGRNKKNFQSKYDTLQPRSRSKTPKLEPHKYRTPKSEMQIRLFRAKSNLGKQKSKRQNRQIRDLSMVQFKEQISPIRQNCLTERQLLQKKKDLERQLNAVNESLLNCKKPAQPKKKVKTVKNNNRKSRGKLSKW